MIILGAVHGDVSTVVGPPAGATIVVGEAESE